MQAQPGRGASTLPKLSEARRTGQERRPFQGLPTRLGAELRGLVGVSVVHRDPTRRVGKNHGGQTEAVHSHTPGLKAGCTLHGTRRGEAKTHRDPDHGTFRGATAVSYKNLKPPVCSSKEARY